jgi:hypothetical protein
MHEAPLRVAPLRDTLSLRRMGKVHVVKPGDHAPKVAWQNGFGDYGTVWGDPDNADLAKARNPCILAEGDVIHLPDRTPKSVSRAIESLHKFKVKRPKIKIKLTLLDVSGNPIADQACTLKVGDDTFALTSTGDGEIEHEVPITTESCTLSVLDEEFSLRVGWLAPVDTPAGCRSRLDNLGYDPGKAEDDLDGAILRSAIEEFQCDQGLDLTGACDDATQSKLIEVHGA